MIEQVEISKRNASLAINNAFETLQQTLEERKKTLLSELEAISLSKTTALTLQKEQFEKMIGDIGHYTDLASHILQTHTDHEIVALGGLIPTELQATLKRVQTISLTPNQESSITVSVQTDDLIQKLSKLGHFYFSPSSSTWTSTSVAKVGARYHVKIQSKTSKGEECPHGGRGQLKNTIGRRGSGDGQFSHPSGIAIKGDVLYVADSGNHRVQKLTSSGKFLHKFGQQGSGQGQFNWPESVIIDSNNKLIVSDNYNHRIQIFSENGGWLLTIDGKGSRNHSFRSPEGLALDPQGNIHVASWAPNTIKVFTIEGVYVRMYGDPNHPNGIAIDDEGYSLVRVGRVMVECEDDTLDSYSEDEKEMEKAERAVEWKMAKMQAARCQDSSEAVTLLLSNQIVAFLNKNASSVEYIHLSDLYTGAARDSEGEVVEEEVGRSEVEVGDNGEGDFPNEGHVVKDSDNCFTVWCTGRNGCDWMMAQLRLTAPAEARSVQFAAVSGTPLPRYCVMIQSVTDKVPQNWFQFTYRVTSAQDPQSFVQFALFLLDHVKSIRLSREVAPFAAVTPSMTIKETFQCIMNWGSGAFTHLVADQLERIVAKRSAEGSIEGDTEPGETAALLETRVMYDRLHSKERKSKEGRKGKKLNKPDPEKTRKWESSGPAAELIVEIQDQEDDVNEAEGATYAAAANTINHPLTWITTWPHTEAYSGFDELGLEGPSENDWSTAELLCHFMKPFQTVMDYLQGQGLTCQAKRKVWTGRPTWQAGLAFGNPVNTYIYGALDAGMAKYFRASRAIWFQPAQTFVARVDQHSIS
eukprot:Em0004g227a